MKSLKKVKNLVQFILFVEKEKQIEAMSFLKRNLLSAPPVWLVPEEYLNKFNSYPALYLERAYKAAFSFFIEVEGYFESYDC